MSPPKILTFVSAKNLSMDFLENLYQYFEEEIHRLHSSDFPTFPKFSKFSRKIDLTFVAAEEQTAEIYETLLTIRHDQKQRKRVDEMSI